MPTPLDQRTIGIRTNELHHGTVIACSGSTAKILEINAALQSGYIDVFMTSQEIAEELVSL